MPLQALQALQARSAQAPHCASGANAEGKSA